MQICVCVRHMGESRNASNLSIPFQEYHKLCRETDRLRHAGMMHKAPAQPLQRSKTSYVTAISVHGLT